MRSSIARCVVMTYAALNTLESMTTGTNTYHVQVVPGINPRQASAIAELLSIFRRPCIKGDTLFCQYRGGFVVEDFGLHGGAQSKRFHGNFHDRPVLFRHPIPHGLVAGQMI